MEWQAAPCLGSSIRKGDHAPLACEATCSLQFRKTAHNCCQLSSPFVSSDPLERFQKPRRGLVSSPFGRAASVGGTAYLGGEPFRGSNHAAIAATPPQPTGLIVPQLRKDHPARGTAYCNFLVDRRCRSGPRSESEDGFRRDASRPQSRS